MTRILPSMKIEWVLRLLTIIAIAMPVSANAWASIRYTWSFGRRIDLHLQLDQTVVPFQDGSASWSAVATDALNAWNGLINAVQLVAAPPAGTPYYGDGVNSAFFSDTIYGESFGSNTLAVTIWNYQTQNSDGIVEADVIFNNAVRFDSYRGPLQQDANGRIFDFRRVALHEFGHVLGLDHPDQHGQSVVALMNSVISDLDHLADDDITGIRTLYWKEFFGQNTDVVAVAGQLVSYRLVANGATSFSATGLPPGLTLDPSSGLISGRPTMSGSYNVSLYAYGSNTLTGTLHIVVPPPAIVSPLRASGVIGSPFRYQIVASHQVTSYESQSLPPGLTLDPVTGVISGIPTIIGQIPYTQIRAHGIYEDAAATLDFSIRLPLPLVDQPLEALPVRVSDLMVADRHRPRLYFATDSGLAVFDTNSRTIVKSFPTGYLIDLALSPDGKTLWVVSTFTPWLTRLDLEKLDQLVNLPISEPIQGVFAGLEDRLYCAARNGETLQIDANSGVIQQRFRPPSDLRLLWGGPAAMSPDARTLYVGETGFIGDSLLSRGALSRYDVSGVVPTFLQRVVLSDPGLTYVSASPAGNNLFVGLRTYDGSGAPYLHSTLCLSAQDLSITKGSLDYIGTSQRVTFSTDGTRAFLPIVQGDGLAGHATMFDVYDIASLQRIQRTVVGTTVPTADVPAPTAVYLSGVCSDLSDDFVFAATNNDEVRTLLVFPLNKVTPAPPSHYPPKSLLNVSTRLRTQTNGDVLIGGFILSGNEPKKIMLRAIGPSLRIDGKLLDPILEVHGSDGRLIAENDNWNSHRAEVLDSGLPPTDQYEAAIVTTLQPGDYTAIVRGLGNTTGIALVELYDLSPSSDSRLVNISTRGKVETGDNVMIGGFILSPGQSTKVIVRAIGPSLGTRGVISALNDTTLDLYDGSGSLVASNDDWQSNQAQEIINTTVPPTDPRESAIVRTLQPGNYTAIVRGKNNTTGVALVEVFNLDN